VSHSCAWQKHNSCVLHVKHGQYFCSTAVQLKIQKVSARKERKRKEKQRKEKKSKEKKRLD